MSAASGPLLTVGVPVYNGADTLERCLESVLTYAPADAQIVISDNGSTDGTERICRQFAERASNIRYFRQERNLGSIANFRFVFEQASTPYFMWLADDDWLGDDFLERALRFLEEHRDYALVSPASAYYDKSSGAYQFATIPTSVEDDDPRRRVEAFLENLTDNSEFYGVYRRAVARFDAPDVMGSDWISVMDTAFVGKIRVLEHAVIHRQNRWDGGERHAAVAQGAGWPAAQAEQPHYATALAALLHVALGAPAYARLRDDERARLALLVFRQFRRNQQLPVEFHFWQDSRRLFGEEFAGSMGHRLRGMLARLCVEALSAANGAAPVDQEVLELAMALKLGAEPMTDGERKSFEASRALLASRGSALAAYAYHALFVPAYKQPRFFRFSEIPYPLLNDYAAYVTAQEMLFEAEGEIDAFTAHFLKVIESTTPDVELPGGAVRVSTHWIRALDAITTRLCMLPCYFAAGTLRGIMEKRARMCASWLRLIGIPIEAVANGGAARPRLRVGMVMQALSSPTDTYTALPAIAELDRSKFETVLFVVRLQHGKDRLTEMEQYAFGLVDRVVVLEGDLNAVVATVRSENLDFLVFGSNLTSACSVPFVLSVCRVARWQIAFNPCCVTSGSEHVDYFVSSTLLEERGAGQDAYCERLLQISGPGHVRATPPFEAQAAAAKRAVPRNDRELRLVSGANYYKLTPATRRTWMQILASVPEASLHLYPFGGAWSVEYDRQRLAGVLKREASEAGVEFERIRMLEAFPDIGAVHRFLGTMDIYLDSFPFSGINSILDPLLSGIPVVTLAGNSFRSNMGASALQEVGLRECIAASPEDYVSIVRKLAADRAALERTKGQIFETMRRGTRFHDVKWFSGEFGRLMQEIAASGTESGLDSLKASIEALGAAGDEAQAAEPQLRARRHALAEQFIVLNHDQSRARFAGQDGEALRLLVKCGLRDLERDAQDQALAERALARLDTAAPAPGALLAAMLMHQAFELPAPKDLRAIPDWLLPDYVRFLIAPPRIFLRPGDADRHCDNLTGTIAALQRYVSHQPALPMSEALLSIFIAESEFLQVYFNERNLKDLYRHRAQIMEGWALSQGAQLAHTFALRAAPAPDRRLRIGILSNHFGPQTETYFMLAHFERFPRERCMLFLYALHEKPGALSQYARSIADAAVDLPIDTMASAAQRIRADDLDVLLIGSNITISASELAFLACFRLARLQVISASSPVTSGTTVADWYLNAEENETRDAAAQYTEQVYRMPGMLTRYAYHLDKEPPTLTLDRRDLGIPKDAVVFFSASNFYKVIPELSALWARIMAQVPDARLMLMPFNTNWAPSYLAQPFSERVRRQVEEAGADPNKVHIIDALPTRADLHGVMSHADIYLDSYPFAGACSLLDPLLVGLPLVARAGRSFRGGVGAGMLRGLGLGDMAADDEESYVARAVALGESAQLRKRERSRIRAAVSPRNPVFDSETGSRNMEAAFIDMVSRAEALDATLLRQPAARLRVAIEQVSGELARDCNPWFRALNDAELIRQLAVPYFQSLPQDGATRHMLDVGACIGQMADPFLAMGWKADLFEPDPACRETLTALARRHGGRAALHATVVNSAGAETVTFYQSTTGLSGLSPSPYAATASTFKVPSIRLSDHVKAQGLERVDFLKIDTEGWDFDALRSHDFAASPPRLAMVEFGTEFPRQSMDAVMQGISEMAAKAYDALVFSYEDDGNFKRQVWRYSLIAAAFDAPVKRKDGHAGGNILFFHRDDSLFLALVLRVLVGFLPACDRPRHYAGLQ